MTEGYGQYCPLAKGAEVFAERWTPLILRELLRGSTTFNDLHRGVPRMSRSLLSSRLRRLESCGVVKRSERANRTLQGRLVNELRAAGITTVAGANRYLREHFQAAYDGWFAHPPADPVSVFTSNPARTPSTP